MPPPRGIEPRRGYLGLLSLKHAILGAFLLCTCIFVLLHDVRYAHIIIGVSVEEFVQPGVTDAKEPGSPLLHHNATDQVLEEKSAASHASTYSIDTKFNTNAPPETDDALTDIDLSVEEIDKDIVDEVDAGELNAVELLGIAVSDATKVKQNGSAVVDTDGAMIEAEWNIPRVIPKKWIPSKKCATAEEMGAETVGDTQAASLRLRALIGDFIAEHGAERVGKLAGEEFCRRGFVLGLAKEDGFGNNMYKVLTAAGLAVMLNRSLIIAEHGGADAPYDVRKQATKPAFGDYLDFSKQAFTVREVRRLWAVHKCATSHKRALIIQSDSLEKGFRHTRCICDDWTSLTVPILHFKGATGSGAIQLLLKNAHPAMRRAAAKLLGNPAIPSSRPNTFGELFRAFITPSGEIQEAVQWALEGGPDPDITLHLRMLHSRTKPAPNAASTCINRLQKSISLKHLTRGQRRRPRVVVVTDTPMIIPGLQKSLGQTVEVIRFNYLAYAKEVTNRSEVMSLKYGIPAHNRLRDWGPMPRWVAMVDFFLAARARTAVVSGAYRRVSTTYAQLVAALANAYTLNGSDPSCVYYSSFQGSLLVSGLASQPGWGHTWRPFGGRLGCRSQVTQCARTALMPYTWWDAPWQSPVSGDVRKLQGFAGIDFSGQVSERVMEKFCVEATRRQSAQVKLQIPSYEEAIAGG